MGPIIYKTNHEDLAYFTGFKTVCHGPRPLGMLRHGPPDLAATDAIALQLAMEAVKKVEAESA